MRVLAVVVALVLVALPFAACGSGGGSSCIGTCGFCNFSSECCGFNLCTNATSSGFAQCSPSDNFCKLAP
jgi:hypothetical protein